MSSGALERWLRRQARQEARRTTLEDVVVFGGFHRYLVYRTGRFTVIRLAETLLHVAELALLFLYAEQRVFVAAVAITLGARVVSDAWWGALESLRAGVRARARDGRYAAIAGWIRRWLAVAAAVASVAAGIALALAIAGAVDRRLDVAQAYMVARLLGLSMEIVVRTFHAGAYALRRIYQPMWSLLASSLAHAAVLLGLWPVAGVWSVAVASLCSVVTGSMLTARYTWRAYTDLGILPTARAARVGRRFRHAFSGRMAAGTVATAAANVAAHSAHLAAVVVLSLGTGDMELWINAFVYFVLAAPLLDACHGWVRLFYPDLMKLEDDLLLPYRRVVHGHLVRWSPAVGTILWLPTLVLLPLLPHGGDAAILAGLTWLFFLVRSRLAAVQLIAFCERRYLDIFLLSGVVALAAVVGWQDPGQGAWWLTVPLLLGTFLVRPPSSPRLVTQPVLPLAAAIAGAATIPGRGTWVLAECRRDRLLHGSHLLLHRVARRVGGLGVHGDGLLLWWEPGNGTQPRGPDLVNGLERRRWRSPFDRAPEALLALGHTGGLVEDGAPCSVDEVIAEFRSRFADGFWVRAGESAEPAVRRLLGWTERRVVLGEALTFSYGRPPETRLPLDVTALLTDGRLAVLFFVQRSADPAKRRAWRRRVRTIGVANAFAALRGTVAAPTAGPIRTRETSARPRTAAPGSTAPGTPESGTTAGGP